MVPNHSLPGMLPISDALQHLGENNDESIVEPHRNCHIGGQNITSLRFADDINGLPGEEQKLKELVECLDKTYSSYGMEILEKVFNQVKSHLAVELLGKMGLTLCLKC